MFFYDPVVLVDEGRDSHSPNYYHHSPKTPTDIVEWAFDTILAFVQIRGYNKNAKLKTAPRDLSWWTDERMLEEAKKQPQISEDVAVGMLKFARYVAYDLPLNYIQQPHANIHNILHD